MDHIAVPIPHIIFKDLDFNEYLNLFTTVNSETLKGSGLTDIAVFEHDNYSNLFRRKHNRTGAGFLSFLSSIARKSLPWIKNIVFPEALNLTSTLIDKHKNTSKNPLKGEEFKNLAKQSIRNIARKTLASSGGFRKKRIKRRKKQKNKKRGRRKYNKKNKKIKTILLRRKIKRGKRRNIKKHSIFDDV